MKEFIVVCQNAKGYWEEKFYGTSEEAVRVHIHISGYAIISLVESGNKFSII